MNKNYIKKSEEKELLNIFLNTDIGKKWCLTNSFSRIIDSETPDFKLKTYNNELFSLEMTKFIFKNKNLYYSQALTTIGNQICKEAEKKYKIRLSILIHRFDKREYSPKWEEVIDYAYNPGFSSTPTKKFFKSELQKLLKNNINKLKTNTFVQQWINIDNEYYQISMQTYPSISSKKFDCHVNNAGQVTINPYEELQACIDKKNSKLQRYKNDYDKSYLLVIVPSASNGNFCHFNFQILEQKFTYMFDKVFLCDEEGQYSYILNK